LRFALYRLKKNILIDLAQLKSIPFQETLAANDILITSDTIVWFENKALGKPKDNNDAFQMLKSLSGHTHEVITSVCFKSIGKEKTINSITKVTFKALSDSEINYYINNFTVLDKAGSYGIQDWIGQIAVTKIEGSYFNVMGFPIDKIYETLLTF
jgi:septum formation protein